LTRDCGCSRILFAAVEGATAKEVIFKGKINKKIILKKWLT
jgi:hypothetical protein